MYDQNGGRNRMETKKEEYQKIWEGIIKRIETTFSLLQTATEYAEEEREYFIKRMKEGKISKIDIVRAQLLWHSVGEASEVLGRVWQNKFKLEQTLNELLNQEKKFQEREEKNK